MENSSKHLDFSPTPFFRRPAVKVMGIWLAWACILLAFQKIVVLRFQPQRPDRVLEWTATETKAGWFPESPYLHNPFMNEHVEMDSEYYLSIAVQGYEDPWVQQMITPAGEKVPLNYAFMPFYPLVMKVFMVPLRIFRMDKVATATLAGVLVSLFGTLGGMFALFDLTRKNASDQDGYRAMFYLLIFPPAFFMAQVYTEGLFVGLAFGCLALLQRRQWIWAVLLACCATLTRAVGVALLVPIGIAWLQDIRTGELKEVPYLARQFGKILVGALPLVTYLAWHSSHLGKMFDWVERDFFGRGILRFGQAWGQWRYAITELAAKNPQTAVYYGIEISIIMVSLIGCLFLIHQRPGLAAFSLLVLLVSIGSASPQSVSRYLLVMPTTYIFLSHLGRSAIFDRAWTLLSLLLMGMLATLFSFNFWVA
jgi:hypothetical protein